MNPYNYYNVGGEQLQLKKCENPECRRLTSALYCCPACDSAHHGKYEIHESGILGHSETCNERYEKRQHLRIK